MFQGCLKATEDDGPGPPRGHDSSAKRIHWGEPYRSIGFDHPPFSVPARHQRTMRKISPSGGPGYGLYGLAERPAVQVLEEDISWPDLLPFQTGKLLPVLPGVGGRVRP